MGDESGQDIPPWGTPDGPPAPVDVPAWGTPGGGSEARAANAGPAVLTRDTLVVVERAGFLSAGGYEVLSAEGEPLGALTEQTGAAGFFFGSVASSTFHLVGPDGRTVGLMERPGSVGRFRFEVRDATGTEVGSVEQENSFFAPQFTLRSVDGPELRLVGGSFGSSEWQLVEARDEARVHGSVSREFSGLAGLLGDTQRFSIRLAPSLTGATRLVAVLATVCLDYVRDEKRRR